MTSQPTTAKQGRFTTTHVGLLLMVVAAGLSGLAGPLFLDAGNTTAFAVCVIAGGVCFLVGVVMLAIGLFNRMRATKRVVP